MLTNAFEALGLGRIVEQISEFCCSEYGKSALGAREFIVDATVLGTEISRVERAAQRIAKSLSADPGILFPLQGVIDKSRKESVLSEEEAGKLLVTVRNAVAFAVKARELKMDEECGVSFGGLTELREFAGSLSRYLSDAGFIRPDATPELRRILQGRDSKRIEIQQKLEHQVQARRKALQDDYFTLRDGRYVLPVKENFKKEIRGIIRDTSQSGDTVFVEPFETSGLNDELHLLGKEEEKEKRRILREVTAELSRHAPAVEGTLATIGTIDSVLARAKYLLRFDLHFPSLSADREIVLKKALHPLFAGKAGIVPNDLVLGSGERILLLTGPNGGGKTVALKTVASIVLLTMRAIPVPVGEGSRTGLFTNLFLDMGDAQDMESGVSSFTSKMRKWKEILDAADDSSMVVIDELGNFTSPAEGAALSCAMISRLMARDARLIAGTHLDQVKEFVANRGKGTIASMLWDEKNFAPCFRIRYGAALGSFAIDVARRAGFPDEFMRECENLLSSDYIYLEGLRKKYEQLVGDLEAKHGELDAHKAEIERLLREKRHQVESIRSRKDRVMERYEKEMDSLVNKYHEKLYEPSSGKKELRRSLEELKQEKAAARERLEGKRRGQAAAIAAGDRVYVPSLKGEGTVAEIDGDMAQVFAGSLRVAVAVGKLRKLGEEAGKPEVRPRAIPVPGTDMSDVEIDVKGMRVDEALAVIDKAIDNARLRNLYTIKIIHGAGKGHLREAVHAFLKTHRSVREFRSGSYLDRGGSYHTIIELN